MLASDASIFGSLIGSLDNPLVYTVNNWPVSTIIDSRVVLYYYYYTPGCGLMGLRNVYTPGCGLMGLRNVI